MELKTGYKQTEVGVIPEEWRVEALGHHVEIKSGESPSLFRFENDGVPYFKVEQLNRNSKYLRDTPYFFRGDKKVPRNSLIFPKRGASILLNKVRILEQDAFMDTNLMTLTPKGSLDHEYLYYALTYIELWRIADTTSIPQINNKHIIPLVLPLPTPLEQRAIAEALGDVDALLGSLEKLIAKKRDLKKAAMQQLLTGQKRLPGFRGEWKPKKVGEMLNYERPDKYIVKSTDYQENAMVPVLTANKSFVLGYTSEDFWVYSSLPAIIFDDFTTDSKYVDFPFKVKSSAIKILKSRNVNTNLKFVYERMRLIQFPLGEHKRYYISEFQHIKFPTPEPDEQAAIAEVLSDMDEEIAALEQRLAKTRALKQGMMQELLTGRVRLV